MKYSKVTGQFIIIFATIFATAFIINARQQSIPRTIKEPADNPHSSCPMMQGRGGSQASTDHAGHADSMAEMNMRGEREMGFSQQKTTHHFLLMRDGGAIEVEVNDLKDTATRNQIRKHLAAIAQAFSDGDFATPFAVHAQIPPGVPVMQRLKAAIIYEYQETERGGRVRISTNNGEALTAIRDFLRFQIREHRTGDTLEDAK